MYTVYTVGVGGGEAVKKGLMKRVGVIFQWIQV
jgi:hypothetical protein